VVTIKVSGEMVVAPPDATSCRRTTWYAVGVPMEGADHAIVGVTPTPACEAVRGCPATVAAVTGLIVGTTVGVPDGGGKVSKIWAYAYAAEVAPGAW